MANELLNSTLTQIAIKRLSGKAMSNANLSIPAETLGSSVQVASQTLFGESIPNNPTNSDAQLYKIQSSSVGDPGTVQLVEFHLVPLDDSKYINDIDTDLSASELVFGVDTGQTAIDTFHAYMCVLTGSYGVDVNAIGASYFADNASTPTSINNSPFTGSFNITGSNKLQIVPEYLSTVTVDNPYKIQISLSSSQDSFSPSDQLSLTSGIDMYFDTFAGVLFVQDPVNYATGTGTVPGKLRAFIYTGKYQDELDNTVRLHISSSNGGEFNLTNNATASFESGSAGITVSASSEGKVTIGSKDDDVTFNNLVVSGTLTAETYVISSSIMHQTTSFSAGSTAFGDTNEDTHAFTGSVLIVHTASNENGNGLEISGSNILVDFGNTGSFTLGQHNVGFELGTAFPLTGSGLIISQSFSSSEATLHNMLKIGESEIVDISGSAISDALLLNVRNKAFIASASSLAQPLFSFAAFDGTTGGFTIFSGSTSISMKHDNTKFILGPAQSAGSIDLDLRGKSINFNAANTANAKGTIRLAVSKSGADARYLISSPTDGYDGSTPKSASYFQYDLQDNFFRYIQGNISASAVSSSGQLFASLSAPTSHNNGIVAVVYDTGSGKFFKTGSYGAGSSGTLVHFHVSGAGANEPGFSLSNLNPTASFQTGSLGLTIFTGSNANTLVFGSSSDVLNASVISATSFTGSIFGTSSVATLAESITITDEEDHAADFAVPFASSSATGNTKLATDATKFTYNPSTGLLSLGTNVTNTFVGLKSNELVVGSAITSFNLVDTNATTINFGGEATTIDIGAAGNSFVNIKGTASIDGDLIVKGTTTTLNVDNLLVEDRYILLGSSSADNSVGGGIIVQQGATNAGAALHWDDGNSVWGIEIGGKDAGSSDIGNVTFPIVTVSSSNTAPGATDTPAMGASDAYRFGQLYVDTSDVHGLYVYLP